MSFSLPVPIGAVLSDLSVHICLYFVLNRFRPKGAWGLGSLRPPFPSSFFPLAPLPPPPSSPSFSSPALPFLSPYPPFPSVCRFLVFYNHPLGFLSAYSDSLPFPPFTPSLFTHSLAFALPFLPSLCLAPRCFYVNCEWLLEGPLTSGRYSAAPTATPAHAVGSPRPCKVARQRYAVAHPDASSPAQYLQPSYDPAVRATIERSGLRPPAARCSRRVRRAARHFASNAAPGFAGGPPFGNRPGCRRVSLAHPSSSHQHLGPILACFPC